MANDAFLIKVGVDVGASFDGIKADINKLIKDVSGQINGVEVKVNPQTLRDSIRTALSGQTYVDVDVRLSKGSVAAIQNSVKKALISMPQLDRQVPVGANTQKLQTDVKDALIKAQREGLNLDVGDGGLANLQSSIQIAFKRALQSPDIIVPSVDTDKLTERIETALKKFNGYKLKITPVVGAPTAGGSGGKGGSGGGSNNKVADLTKWTERVSTAYTTYDMLNSAVKRDVWKDLSIPTDELDNLTHLTENARNLFDTFKQNAQYDPDLRRFIVDEKNLSIAQRYIKVVEELNRKQKEVQNTARELLKPDKDEASSLTILRQYDSLVKTLETGAFTTKRRSGLNELKAAFKIYEQSPQSKADLEALAATTRKVEIELRNAGAMAETAGEKLERMLGTKIGYAVITAGIMMVRRAIRQLYTNVLQLDTAMTELKKVTDETDEAYDRFLKDAAKRARNLGSSLVDIVSATADAARLGLDITDASALADAAIVYKNVGDGLADINEASESIISTMQAFGVEAVDSMKIVDKFNEVANNFAISSGGIGDAMLNSASALEAANNTLDESIALITATNEVIQDPQKVGTALKTVSMYLRAAKTEAEDAGESTEGMADSVSKLREDLLSLTGQRLDIMTDDNSFKSTYQIMKELSAIWDTLTDVTQANILEKIGGKRNSNVVTALLGNFDQAEKALTTSLNSAGSALQENERYLESIQGKLNQLAASWQTLSNNLLDSGLVKGVVDILRMLLDGFNMLDEVTGGISSGAVALATAFVLLRSVIGAFKADLFGFGALINVLSGALSFNTKATNQNTGSKAVNGHVTTVQTGKVIAHVAARKKETNATLLSTLANSKLGVALAKVGGVLSSAIAAHPIIALSVACVGAAAAAIGLSRAAESLKLKKAKEQVENLSSECEELSSQVADNTSRISELKQLASSGAISIVEQNELNDLQVENKLLEDQLAIKERLLAVNKEIVANAAEQSVQDYFVGGKYGGLVASGQAKTNALLEQYKAAEENYLTNAPNWSDERKQSGINTLTDIESDLLERQQELLGLMEAQDTTTQKGKNNYNRLQQEYDRIAIAINGAAAASEVFGHVVLRNSKASGLLEKMANGGYLTADAIEELYNAPHDDRVKKFVDELVAFGTIEPGRFDLIANYFNRIEEAADDASVSIKDVVDTTESVVDKYDALKSAQKEYAETGRLSLDTLSSIAEKYEGLDEDIALYIAGLKSEKDLIAAIQGSYSTDVDNYRDALENKLRHSEAFYNALSDNEKTKIDSLGESYGVDLKNFKTIESKKLAFQSEVIKSLATNYAKYNNASLPFLKYQQQILKFQINQSGGSGKYVAELAAVNQMIAAFEEMNAITDGLIPDLDTWNPSKFSDKLGEEVDYDKVYKNLVKQKELVEQNTERMARMEGDFSEEQIQMWKDLRKAIIEKMAAVEKGSEAYHYLEDMLWEVNDAIEEVYDNQTDAIQNIIDLTREMIEEEYEDQKEAIEKQVDAYNDLIDAKKKALQVDKEANDYNKKVAEKTKEIAKLQSRIALLSLDDSRKAQAEKASLEEELAKEQSELADLQAERGLELTEDALDESADKFEKAKDKEIEAIEAILDDEARLYKETIQKIGNMENHFYQQLEKWAKEHGKDIRELAKDWDVAKNAKKGYTDLDAALSGIAGNKDSLGSLTTDGSYGEIGGNLDAMPNAGASGTIAAGNPYREPTKNIGMNDTGEGVAWVQYQLIKMNRLKTSDGNPTWQFWKSTLEAVKQFQRDHDLDDDGVVGPLTREKLKKYHTGGIVGGHGSLRDNELMSILEKNEIVMANGHKMNLSSLFDNLRNTIGELVSGNLMRSMDRMRAPIPAGGDTIAPQINVTIQHNGTMSDSDAKKYGSMVGDEAIKKLHEAFIKRGK